MTWAAIIGGLAALWAWATLCVAVAAVYKRWRLGQKQTKTLNENVRVLVVRPCSGEEPHLEQCLSSMKDARSTDNIDVIMAVDDDNDTALPAIRRAYSLLHEQGIRAEALVVGPRGANRKASILAGVLAERGANYDVIINADSNVDLSGFELASLVAPFGHQPGLGALWVPPVEVSGLSSVGNRASEAVLSASFHSFPLLCGVDETGLVGKLFAVRVSALESVGGFAGLVDYLGEDFELSRRLVEAGCEVGPVAAVARSLSGEKSFVSTVSRHARWMTVIRAQRPIHLLSYPLWFFPLPLILLLAIAAMFGAHAFLGWFAAAVALVARLTVALSARRFSRLPMSLNTVVDLMLADLVLALAWLKALSSRQVCWRGRNLVIDASGRVKPLASHR